ncbi:hypothetical protein ACFLZ8_05390 [Planctomycetota bacterium]
MFDYACVGYVHETRLSVEIGGPQVLSRQREMVLTQGKSQYDIEIDVSGFSGYKVLSFKVENKFNGWFDAFVFWDNIRTYDPAGGSVFSGSIISTPISIDSNDTWDIVTFNTTVLVGT